MAPLGAVSMRPASGLTRTGVQLRRLGVMRQRTGVEFVSVLAVLWFGWHALLLCGCAELENNTL